MLRAAITTMLSVIFLNGMHVLVTATAHVDEDDVFLWQGGGKLDGVGDRVGGLQRRDDALGAAEHFYALERLLVRGGHVRGAARVL